MAADWEEIVMYSPNAIDTQQQERATLVLQKTVTSIAFTSLLQRQTVSLYC